MTLTEFFKSRYKLAIHCNTLEKAKKLSEAFVAKDYLLYDDIRYAHKIDYYCGDKTCYDNNNSFSLIDTYKSNGYKIIEFEDIDLK